MKEYYVLRLQGSPFEQEAALDSQAEGGWSLIAVIYTPSLGPVAYMEREKAL